MSISRETSLQALWTLRLLAVAAGLVLCGSALPGCNTTEGVGEDIEAAGDAIDDAAENANK